MQRPRELVALGLVVLLVVTLGPLAIGSAIRQVRTGAPISEQAAALMATVCGAAVGALAGYLGGRPPDA